MELLFNLERATQNLCDACPVVVLTKLNLYSCVSDAQSSTGWTAAALARGSPSSVWSYLFWNSSFQTHWSQGPIMLWKITEDTKGLCKKYGVYQYMVRMLKIKILKHRHIQKHTPWVLRATSPDLVKLLETSTVHLCKNMSEMGKNLPRCLTWWMADGSWQPQRVLRLHFLQLCSSENIFRLVPALKKDIFIYFPSSPMSSWLFFYNQILKKVKLQLESHEVWIPTHD